MFRTGSVQAAMKAPTRPCLFWRFWERILVLSFPASSGQVCERLSPSSSSLPHSVSVLTAFCEPDSAHPCVTYKDPHDRTWPTQRTQDDHSFSRLPTSIRIHLAHTGSQMFCPNLYPHTCQVSAIQYSHGYKTPKVEGGPLPSQGSPCTTSRSPLSSTN